MRIYTQFQEKKFWESLLWVGSFSQKSESQVANSQGDR